MMDGEECSVGEGGGACGGGLDGLEFRGSWSPSKQRCQE